MNRLEERVYVNYLNDAVLKVTDTDARFRIDNTLEENNYLNEVFQRKELHLEKYPYLQSFLNETQYMELGYKREERLFYVALYSLKKEIGNKKTNTFCLKRKIQEKKGLDFSSIFEDLNSSLMMDLYKRYKRVSIEDLVFRSSLRKMFLKIGYDFRNNSFSGALVFLGKRKIIYDEEIELKELELKNYPHLTNCLASGKEMTISYIGGKSYRASIIRRKKEIKDYKKPFAIETIESVKGDYIQECLEKLENSLEETRTLVRKKNVNRNT